MSLDVRTVGDVTVLTPKGMLLGGKETDELQAKIRELTEAGNKKLLINLEKTTFMNSVSLGVLIGGHTSYAKRGAKMKLAAVDDIEGGAQFTTELTFERENGDKPVCVAESLTRVYTGP